MFGALLVAALPPAFAVIAVGQLLGRASTSMSPALAPLVLVVAIVAWAALLAVVYAGGLDEEMRSILTIARRGERPPELDVGDGYQQLVGSLDERNRQVTALARQARLVPIDRSPSTVVTSLVTAVRDVMHDATWRCAVLLSDVPELLQAGVYHGSEDPDAIEPLGTLEQWASVAEPHAPVRHAVGPWGAFAIVELSMTEGVHAVLYAPWEGRPAPTPSEVDLLTLVGQHAAAALEHSILYARVRTQADELNRMALVQADFLRGVTHDLQTPLTSIAALATELRANPDVPLAARDDLASITHQSERLRRMVGQLLVASRLEAGVVKPQQEVFAVRPLIERTWNALRADRPFTIASEGAPHLAVADAHGLEQVLWAVFDNAVKYSPEQSPIHVQIVSDSGQIQIAISDRGAGMDAETLRHAFDQFYRAEHARRIAPDGSGVGLYAVRGLMAAMGGSVTLESQTGAGSQVTLYLPGESASDELG